MTSKVVLQSTIN